MATPVPQLPLHKGFSPEGRAEHYEPLALWWQGPSPDPNISGRARVWLERSKVRRLAIMLARQQCALRRLPAGPGVGGEPSLSRSSSPLRARPWVVLGRRPRYLGRAPALHWTGCSTSPPMQGPAACPCGPNSGPRAVVGVVVGAR